MQDFNYIMGNCMELTLELSEDKHPDPLELGILWEQNKNAFLDFAISTTLRSFRQRILQRNAPWLDAVHVLGDLCMARAMSP